MKERIQKILANAGVDSRRNIEQMVLDGRIGVNGRIVHKLPVLIDPAADRIEVDGQRVRLGTPKTERRFYILMHKPKGIYTTNVAQGEQVRAIDLLPPDLGARLYPVGRLDADSSGVLLLTNDGELTHQLTHPRYGIIRTYRALVDGHVGPHTLDQLQKGIWLADKAGKGFKTGRAHIRVAFSTRESSVLEITTREGHNRELRRVLAKLGHKVRELARIKMGPLTLHGLAAGQSRALTPRELRELRKVPQPTKPPAAKPKTPGNRQ